MLNDRKKQILQAIIEEYIQTAEPVSSNAIVQKYNLDYSSATVRNEMASLENIQNAANEQGLSYKNENVKVISGEE